MKQKEIKRLFELLDIEGFDKIRTLGFESPVFKFMMSGKIYQHFLTRVIEAINRSCVSKKEYIPYIQINPVISGRWYYLITHKEDINEIESIAYDSIDDCKIAALRKYLGVVE